MEITAHIRLKLSVIIYFDNNMILSYRGKYNDIHVKNTGIEMYGLI